MQENCVSKTEMENYLRYLKLGVNYYNKDLALKYSEIIYQDIINDTNPLVLEETIDDWKELSTKSLLRRFWRECYVSYYGSSNEGVAGLLLAKIKLAKENGIVFNLDEITEFESIDDIKPNLTFIKTLFELEN